jgi:hypothetical protein
MGSLAHRCNSGGKKRGEVTLQDRQTLSRVRRKPRSTRCWRRACGPPGETVASFPFYQPKLTAKALFVANQRLGYSTKISQITISIGGSAVPIPFDSVGSHVIFILWEFWRDVCFG